MKLLIAPALFGALLAATSTPCFAAAAAKPVKPPAKGAAEKTAPPADAYGVFSFDKAKAEAEKKNRPLVFILSDERADDTAVKAATNKGYWTFWDDAVVVVLRPSTANEWTRLPDPVQKAMKSPDLGKESPKIIGFDESATTPLLGMKAGQVVDSKEKDLDKIAKSLKAANKTKTPSTEFPPPSLDAPPPAAPAKPAAPATAATPPAPATPAPAPGTPPAATPPATPAPAPAAPAVILIKGAQMENWTNAEGRAIQATLAEAGADKVVFVMANGGRVEYEIAKLSDASKKRVQDLKAASTPK